MVKHFFLIDDEVAEASPMLGRMRLDGLHRAWVPFAERHFLAWRGAPEPEMEIETLVNALKVRFGTLPTLRPCSA